MVYTYLWNRWFDNTSAGKYHYPRLFSTANQYSQNVRETNATVGDGAYMLCNGQTGQDVPWYAGILSSDNREYKASLADPLGRVKCTYIPL